MDRPLVVIDTESATAAGAPHLLELGAVRVVEGEIVDTFESLVCPTVPIEQETIEVHGIDESAVRSAPETPEVLEQFRDWLGDDWLAAHNAGSDASVLGFAYGRFKVEDAPEAPILDSLPLARKFLPEAPDHKLHTLAEELELEEGQRHRALSDAVTCWKVIEECLERMGGLAEVRLTELLTRGGRAAVTVASRIPEEPRLPVRLKRLRQLAEDGEPVTMLYGKPDGQPGRLDVIPRWLYQNHGKGYLEAECNSSGLLKTYLLDRVRKLL